MGGEMQDKDFDWFLEHYDELYKEYGDAYIAIKNGKVLGVYSSYAEGVRKTQATEEIGTFIVQHCNGNETGHTNYISSMNFMGAVG